MTTLEVLCTTMNQSDFSIYKRMRLNSDVVFANQTNQDSTEACLIDGHKVIMISTKTRGVGTNRNIALLNASAQICLLSDDDVRYENNYVDLVLQEFNTHQEADVIIFNIGTNTPEFGRIPTQIKKFKRLHNLSKNPYGAPRIAFRLSSIRKSNIKFSTLFGGGALFPNGEDSLWINLLMKSGIKVFLSPKMIGNVSYNNSSWLTEDGKRLCFGKGALLEARPIKFKFLYMLYYSFFRRPKNINGFCALRWVKYGRKGYKQLVSYETFCERLKV